MKFASTAMASTGTLFTLAQQAGALANVLIPITSSIPGAVASKVINSDNEPFANLPQPAARLCESQLEGTTVTFSSKPQNGVRVDCVPPACMTLADVFLGQDPQQPAAIPVGVSSLEYHNLREGQLERLYDVFDRTHRLQGL